MVLEGDASKIRKAMGGMEIPFERTLKICSRTGASGRCRRPADTGERGAAMNVALVHDWLTGMRGGERCLEVFCELFPAAPVFTLLHTPGSVSPTIERRPIRTSFIQRLPDAERRYRYYLPLFPAAVRGFDLRGYDLILSASHAVAKSARVPAGALHVCYCFTPMRYVWDLYDEYFGPRAGLPARLLMPPVAAALRRWDRQSAAGVHHFVAISRFIADRIRRAYGRESDVIYPPVASPASGSKRAGRFYRWSPR